MTRPDGKVYILGSGPGSVNFLTVAGEALLSTAEVVIYDALIDTTLLSLTPKTCIHILAGKRGQGPSVSQADINPLLVHYCQQGKRVVRLKSGDPMLFGRSASEVQALQAAGCAFEVWPGLSSALAAPVLAGIPLTDPDLSRSVTILSAHEPSTLNWSVLAQCETLVVLMGGRSLPILTTMLQQHGKAADTPVAVIRWGGWPQQQVWSATLDTIVDQTQGESLSPSVLVIGDVVRLRQTLNLPPLPTVRLSCTLPSSVAPMEQSALPLQGRTVLVTRSANQSEDFSRSLKAKGATVLEMAALEIGPPSSWSDLDAALADLSTFDWLILTSANGVQYTLERLQHQGKDARALAGIKIAVVGRKTAATLKQWGLIPDFIPPDYIADALVAHFPEPSLQGIRCLFPRVESGGREVLVQELSAKGATVVEVAAYQSQCPAQLNPQILEALQSQAIDVATFASSKTVQHFAQLLQQGTADLPNFDWRTLLQSVKLASIGPQTSQACGQYLGRVDLEAQEYTLDGLIEAIAQAYTSANP
ncbi:MAG TPA: uroporphyrinogen-III C-methyltransferase [Stenomitos sp.]